MYKYTLNGETYYVSDDRLYVTLDEEHGLHEIDDHDIHLYSFDEYQELLVRLEWGGEVHSSVKVVSIGDRGPPERYVNADEFESATPMKAITPDGIQECPSCGGWAGKENTDPQCFDCGYGIIESSS